MKAGEVDKSLVNEAVPFIPLAAAGARMAAPYIARGLQAVGSALGRRGAKPATNAVRQDPKFDLPPVTPNFRQPGTTPAQYSTPGGPGIPKPQTITPTNPPDTPPVTFQGRSAPASPAAPSAQTAPRAGSINMPSTQAPTGTAGPAAGGRSYTPVDPKSTVIPKPDAGTAGGATLGQKVAGAATAVGTVGTGIGTIGGGSTPSAPVAPSSASTGQSQPLPPGVTPSTAGAGRSAGPGGASFADRLKAAQAQGWPDNDRLPPSDWAPMGKPRNTDGGELDQLTRNAGIPSARSVTPAVQPAAAATTPSTPAAAPKQQFSQGVQDIAKLNNISNPNLIKVGQTLQLPGGGSYTVQRGDTLSGISAGKFKGDAPSTPASSADTGVRPGENPNISPATRNLAMQQAAAADAADAALARSKGQPPLPSLPTISPRSEPVTPVNIVQRQPVTSVNVSGKPDTEPPPNITQTPATKDTDDDTEENMINVHESLERILQLSGYKKYESK